MRFYSGILDPVNRLLEEPVNSEMNLGKVGHALLVGLYKVFSLLVLMVQTSMLAADLKTQISWQQLMTSVL